MSWRRPGLLKSDFARYDAGALALSSSDLSVRFYGETDRAFGVRDGRFRPECRDSMLPWCSCRPKPDPGFAQAPHLPSVIWPMYFGIRER